MLPHEEYMYRELVNLLVANLYTAFWGIPTIFEKHTTPQSSVTVLRFSVKYCDYGFPLWIRNSSSVRLESFLALSRSLSSLLIGTYTIPFGFRKDCGLC